MNARSLLDLTNEADRQRQRACELEEACSFLREQLQEYGAKELLIKALLMAGNVVLAFALCEQDKDLRGPANNATGLVFAAVLYLLSGRNSACSILEQILRDQSETKTFSMNTAGCFTTV